MKVTLTALLAAAALALPAGANAATPQGVARCLHGTVTNERGFPIPKGAGHVGGDQAPTFAERLEHQPQRIEVTPCLLNSHDIEARHDLGDAADVEEVALGRVIRPRTPLLGHIAEAPNIPRCDEKVAVELFRRDSAIKRGDQLAEYTHAFNRDEREERVRDAMAAAMAGR